MYWDLCWYTAAHTQKGPNWIQNFSQADRPKGSSGGSDGNDSACIAQDLGSIPGSGRSLEKEMATHSSILAWEIPWTEEPDGLQSMGSQKSRTQLKQLTGHARVTNYPQM